MIVLEREAVRAFDRWAIEQVGVESLVLMENAARGVVDCLRARWPHCRRVLIPCGPGNNGADGLAVARLLRQHDIESRVVLLSRSKMLEDSDSEPARQLAWAELLGGELCEELPDPREFDLIVDALFGSGLSRPLEGRARRWVERCNVSGTPILAVDSPSGLGTRQAAEDAEEPPESCCMQATVTVTFAASEPVHWIGEQSESVGDLVVQHIGVPLNEWPDLPRSLFVLDACRLGEWLGPPRRAATHKGTFGHLLLVAGGLGMSGAAALAARAALRSGVGLLTVATPAAVRAEVAVQVREAMTLAIDGERLSESSVEELLERGERVDALALGPGLGRGEGVAGAVQRLVEQWPAPLVLDADGLNAFEDLARLGEALAAVPGRQVVLTPHPGELARLVGGSAADVQADRLQAVRQAAESTGATVLLKGHRTLISQPDGVTWINPTGNPGLATGGSGDVLTGMVGALLAGGQPAPVAAAAAAWLHGRAADLAAVQIGEEALLPSDVVEHLAKARLEVPSGREGSGSSGLRFGDERELDV